MRMYNRRGDKTTKQLAFGRCERDASDHRARQLPSNYRRGTRAVVLLS